MNTYNLVISRVSFELREETHSAFFCQISAIYMDRFLQTRHQIKCIHAYFQFVMSINFPRAYGLSSLLDITGMTDFSDE